MEDYKFSEKNAKLQYENARKLMTFLKTEIIFVFTFIQWKQIMIAIHGGVGLSIWFLPIFILTIFETAGYFVYRSVKLQ